jgi:hypothetical protein
MKMAQDKGDFAARVLSGDEKYFPKRELGQQNLR